MIYACFTEPRKDEVIFQNVIGRLREGLLHHADDPGSVFKDTISATLGSYNIRRMSVTSEMLDRVSLEKAYRFYKNCFSDASAFTFTFVGNLDTVDYPH